jgi:hypothetical protein
MLWSPCALIGAVFALGVTQSFSDSLSFLGFLALAPVVLVWLLFESICGAIEISRKKWRRLASLCMIVGGICVGGTPLLRASATAGDYIHLLVYYPFYRAQI